MNKVLEKIRKVFVTESSAEKTAKDVIRKYDKTLSDLADYDRKTKHHLPDTQRH